MKIKYGTESRQMNGVFNRGSRLVLLNLFFEIFSKGRGYILGLGSKQYDRSKRDDS
jgi:hypothetical protein